MGGGGNNHTSDRDLIGLFAILTEPKSVNTGVPSFIINTF